MKSSIEYLCSTKLTQSWDTKGLITEVGSPRIRGPRTLLYRNLGKAEDLDHKTITLTHLFNLMTFHRIQLLNHYIPWYTMGIFKWYIVYCIWNTVYNSISIKLIRIILYIYLDLHVYLFESSSWLCVSKLFNSCLREYLVNDKDGKVVSMVQNK